MSLLLGTPAPPPEVTLPLAPERAALERLARNAGTKALRDQALVELMALEIAAGDELGFARLRHELAAIALPSAVATLFRVRVTWGLARFGRVTAAARVRRQVEADRDAAQVRAWLLELDRLLDLSTR